MEKKTLWASVHLKPPYVYDGTMPSLDRVIALENLQKRVRTFMNPHGEAFSQRDVAILDELYLGGMRMETPVVHERAPSS